MSTLLKWVPGQISTEEKWILGQMGAGGNGHWSRWALEQTGIWGRMGNLVCPKCLYAHCHFFPKSIYPQCRFASVPICPSAYLLQSLFAPVPICPGACCLPVPISPKSPLAFGLFSIYPKSLFALVPIFTGAHLPRYSFPQNPFFPNVILVSYKNVCSHTVP